jgi:hypothetical protein
VESAAIGTCSRGAATLLGETFGWEVLYNTYGGILPNITRLIVNIKRMSIQAQISGITCLLRTTEARPFQGIAAVRSGAITGFTAEEGASIETSGGAFFCNMMGTAHFAGEATSTTVRGGTESITIDLI